jgi:hypothetical protein
VALVIPEMGQHPVQTDTATPYLLDVVNMILGLAVCQEMRYVCVVFYSGMPIDGSLLAQASPSTQIRNRMLQPDRNMYPK